MVKKVIICFSIIIVVILVIVVAYNLFYKKNNNIDNENPTVAELNIESGPTEENGGLVPEKPTKDDVLGITYNLVKGRNLYNIDYSKGNFMEEFITKYDFIDNGFEITVKTFFVKENGNNYEIYADNNFSKKLVELSKSDYREGVKDNSEDEINNESIDGLINENELKSYKYIFKSDSTETKYTFDKVQEIN